MTQTQNGVQQHQQQGTDEVDEGRAAAVAQALMIVLALGMGGAGLVLPLEDNSPADPVSMLIVTEDATEGCPGSGVLLTYGADDNQDGTLETAEQDGTTTICDGAHGSNGAPGANGASVRMTTSTVLPGETCPEGGLAYAWGLDLDVNGTLDSGEVLETSFLCHGTEGADGAVGADGQPGLDGQDGSDGTDGQPGATALITSEQPDPGVCPVGLLLHIGLDDGLHGVAEDGLLQPGEIDETVRICASDLRSGPLSDLRQGIADSVSPSCDAMAHVGDDLFVAMTDGTLGCELHRFASGWQTPSLVADLNPTGDAQPGLHLGLVSAADHGTVFFDATGANGHRGLWALNTSTLDTTPLITDAAGATVDAGSMLIPWMNGHVLTRPGGVGLPWWTDGTVEGTMTLDLHPAVADGTALQAWANGMLRIGIDLGLGDHNGLWLDAEDASGDVEPVLIREDGTVQEFDIWPAGSSSPASGIVVHTGILVVGTTPEGRQLIHLDPAQPPRQVTHLVRSGSGQAPAFVGTTFGLMALGEVVVFDAVLDGADASLWSWNTSTDEVLRLSTSMMNPGGDMAPVEHHGRLWFSCVIVANGSEPCSTDGTQNGTVMHELASGWTGSLPRAAAPFLDGIAVLADVGTGFALHHLDLNGTHPLHDPNPSGDADAGRYGRLLVDDDRIVFVAHDGSSGHEVHGWSHGGMTQSWLIWP